MKTYQIKTKKILVSVYKIQAETKELAIKAFNNRETVRIHEHLEREEEVVEISSTTKKMDFEMDVHTEHCCLTCGCKYGDKSCSVTTEEKIQSYTHKQLCDW